jgi:hypothetical protein
VGAANVSSTAASPSESDLCKEYIVVQQFEILCAKLEATQIEILLRGRTMRPEIQGKGFDLTMFQR